MPVTYSTHTLTFLSSFILFFFFSCYADHRDLHSFPTRRSSDLLFRDQVPEAREVGLEVASRQGVERPCEAERIVTDGEPDATVADVQRKIAHAQGEPADVCVSTSMRRRESKNGKRGHHHGQMVMRRSSRPWPSMTLCASLNSRPASAVRSGASFSCGYCRVLARTRHWTPLSTSVGPMITATPAAASLISYSGSACCFSFVIVVARGSASERL